MDADSHPHDRPFTFELAAYLHLTRALLIKMKAGSILN